MNRRSTGPRARMLLAVSAALVLGAAVTPSVAAAAGYYDQYGRWQDDCGNNTVAGAAVGAGVGALAGSGMAGRGHRTDGSLLGAVVGGVLGAAVGHDSGCRKAPPPPPVAYEVAPPPPAPVIEERRYDEGRYDDRRYDTDRYAEVERLPPPDYDYGVDAPPPPPPPPGYVLGPAYYGPPSTEVVVIRSGRYPYYFYPRGYHYRHYRRW